MVLAFGLSASAQDVVTTTSNDANNPPWGWRGWANSSDIYRAYEMNLDAFGFGTVDEHTIDHFSAHRVHRDAQIGLGAGLEFFLNKWVGLEGEGYSESTHHTFVNDAGGNLILRYPIGNTGWAPYIFGGGGHQFEPVNSAYADGGGGVEYRFNHWIGIFTDARWVATSHTGNYGMGRIGAQFSF